MVRAHVRGRGRGRGREERGGTSPQRRRESGGEIQVSGRGSLRGRGNSRGSTGGPLAGSCSPSIRDQSVEVQRNQPFVVAQFEKSVDALDGDYILKIGLQFVGFDDRRQKVRNDLNMKRFRAHYGCGPKGLAALYKDLINSQHNNVDSFNLRDFLMAFNWLKLYDTQHVLAGRWGLYEETISVKLLDYTKAIQGLKEEKIKWGDFHHEEVFVISIDGVHFRIFEPRGDPGAHWYDHKSNSAGVTYELGIAIRSSRLVWVRGPFPASQHDLTTFRGGKKQGPKDPTALQFQLGPGQRGVGDSGYQGEPNKVTTTRDGHSTELKKWLARVKARHETFNTRLKFYKSLEHRFRHGFQQHQIVMEAVCVAVQYDMENGNPLFEI